MSKRSEIKKYENYEKTFKYFDKELTFELKEKITNEINKVFSKRFNSFDQIVRNGVYSDIEDNNYLCPICGFMFSIKDNKINYFDTDLDN